MCNRWCGIMVLKQRAKLLQKYIREKKQQWDGSELWRMPFLIRFVKYAIHLITDIRSIKNKLKIRKWLQWRANSSPSFGSGNQELSKANWGWSWMDRWISARPWESRVAALDSPKKAHSPHPKKTVKNSISPTINKVKLISPTGKAPRKLSYGAAVKKVNPKGEEEKKTKSEI